jgi:hypothetical protein
MALLVETSAGKRWDDGKIDQVVSTPAGVARWPPLTSASHSISVTTQRQNNYVLEYSASWSWIAHTTAHFCPPPPCVYFALPPACTRPPPPCVYFAPPPLACTLPLPPCMYFAPLGVTVIHKQPLALCSMPQAN